MLRVARFELRIDRQEKKNPQHVTRNGKIKPQNVMKAVMKNFPNQQF
jgi:hypothetical protein